MRINWNEPRFDKDDLEHIKEVLETAYVNEGPKSKELEEKLKEYLGTRHIILTTSATAALFLAIKADSIIKKITDFEVIVPDLTMFATATAVEWAGGKPILVDVEKEKITIDVNKIEEKITPKTMAIIPVHTLGRSSDMGTLNNLAQKHNLTIIEDAAGALGSKYEGISYLGSMGKLGCFSLQSNKIITCGQGGIIATNDDQYNEVIRRLRDFGRFDKKEFVHEKIGFNLKFNDLSAALALGQFEKIEKRKDLLKNQFDQYKQELSSITQIKFFPYQEGEIPLWIDIIAEKRDELNDYLISQNIHPRKEWPSLHMNPPYIKQGNDGDFQNSSFFSKNVLWLPNGPAINKEQITLISSKIKEFYNG